MKDARLKEESSECYKKRQNLFYHLEMYKKRKNELTSINQQLNQIRDQMAEAVRLEKEEEFELQVDLEKKMLRKLRIVEQDVASWGELALAKAVDYKEVCELK